MSSTRTTAEPGRTPSADLDTSFDRYARILERSLGVPVAAVTRIEDRSQVFLGAAGLPPELMEHREIPLTYSFCRQVVVGEQPLVVARTREDARTRDNPSVTEHGVEAYAGWPVRDHRGAVIASVCAMDVVARDWSVAELAILEDVADACSAEMSQRGLRALAHEVAAGARRREATMAAMLAISQAFAPVRTAREVADKLREIAVEQLGCLQAGLWRLAEVAPGTGETRRGGGSAGGGARTVGCPRDPGEAHDEPSVLTYVVPVRDSWASAGNNTVLPDDHTNPLGDALRLGRRLHYPDRASQNVVYPACDVRDQVGEDRVFLPLVVGDHQHGVMALVWPEPREMTTETFAILDALAATVAQALDRALLVQRRLDDLVTLQRSLLPALPRPPHLELAARYHPAARHDQVGGDWYDAVQNPGGATTLTIGDVVGHCVSAAATMGHLRNMLRAFAWALDTPPSQSVRLLDEAMRDLDVAGMATLVHARLEPPADGSGAWHLHWTNAGHPPPLLLPPEGPPTWLGVEDGIGDLMLGVDPTTARLDSHAILPAGSVLLLFTDGLVERRGEDLTLGLRRLAERAGALPRDGDVATLLDALLDAMDHRQPEDDVALLAVRVGAGSAERTLPLVPPDA